MTTDLQLIDRAIKRIEDPDNWTQRAFARDKHGNLMKSFGDPRSTQWCALGALGEEEFQAFGIAPMSPYARIVKRIEAAMGSAVGSYNDSHEHEEVIDRMREAREAIAAQGDTAP